MYMPEPFEILECRECGSRDHHEKADDDRQATHVSISTVCNSCGHSSVTRTIMKPNPPPDNTIYQKMMEPVRRF